MARWGSVKRPIETVDLTGDDDTRWQSQPRKVPRASDAERFSRSQRDTWIDPDREVEEDADDIIILSQDGDISATETFELYGQQLLGA